MKLNKSFQWVSVTLLVHLKKILVGNVYVRRPLLDTLAMNARLDTETMIVPHVKVVTINIMEHATVGIESFDKFQSTCNKFPLL